MPGSRQTRRSKSTPPDQPRRVLVADDDRSVAQSLVKAIQQMGYELVGPATTGRAAVELAREQQPDIAILDIRMPDMDGLEAGRILWGEMGVPLIYLSAFSNPEYLQRAMDVGAFGYLIKPATLDDLRVHLGVAWARYRDWLSAGGV